MRIFWNSYITGPILGVLWAFVIATTVSVLLSFMTGEAFRPGLIGCLLLGALVGVVSVEPFDRRLLAAGAVILTLALTYTPFGPIHVAETVGLGGHLAVAVGFGIGLAWPILVMFDGCPKGALNRHEWEEAVIRFLTGFGYIFFTAAVAIPFYVMVMTSLKTQGELIANPLDFTIDLSRGWALLRSYEELFRDFNFGSYLWTSFYISILTVLITLLFSIPGAYAVARLRFKGQKSLSRSILLIYMVPMIVLALPIYIAFSMTGLRNSITGIVMIYPVTTIPVALYMLQGYFRGLPAEIEEAGLMDGLSRLQVIWKITLPLSLPALASVSLYVFMIAWNEFLLAFMLLDDPSKFTLTRGIASLNSSEIPRQHLMAGAVIATVPVMALFLGLEKFMTRGLTAGSVKG
ncbi:ABC transporter permease subunit [Roseobacter sp. HKCCD9010]|uniref:carbohydrate ABC transporter permease n=1 Tax=unclassified Roseobacter TaxID=196798 RepID=UPI0014909A63|nr:MULTISPECIES: carbohydrate ABC transporter permease [unclassified Roseobacter]MBF9051314.1 ABC transporter permease subunit [Rhodobacterales bacterium HKCCD4356]NNV13361.1 ABC transporter permease subunit [Roseobacter sp. HKCCD7357]NNV17612.1 ABC transporter permease subunit [Roseobacter sp. HKCCD8768]NNV27218.1 ABC transporter permease subunit [Roseobacter sp. HKCCD8192]NNV31338.1 ABC transporter permease subunit [Roseobacter sp. HKCCD9061]